MSNPPLHILYLPRWYPNRYDPMPGLFIRRHAEAASVHCLISVVYVHATIDKIRGVEVLKTSEPRLLTVHLYYSQSQNKLLNIWRFFKANILGFKVVRQEIGLPDITHVHVLTRLAVVAWWFRMRFGIPYLVTEHWSRYISSRNEFKGFARKWLTRFLVRQASMVTTVTRNLADAMLAHGLRNSHYRILPNVVDTALFKPTDPKKSNPKRIIHISCFEDRSKNISGLLRALQMLSQNRSDFESIMVGDGMDFTALTTYADSLGLKPFVKFTGLLEGETLAATLSSGVFLVLFSNYENLPVVIPEAMACGLPVVATDVGGIAEVVNKQNGILVETGNETKLTEALNWMLDHVDQFNPEAIRKTVIDLNSCQAVGILLNNWYSEIKKDVRPASPDQTGT